MSDIDKYLNKMQSIADKNTSKSQSFAREEMSFNSKEAEKNRTWQKMMSDTAHQREVNDLVQAGLNPVLSSGGQGASTGSGAMATGAKGDVDNSVIPALTQIINTQANNAAALEQARIHANASLSAANISAGASVAAARMAANASMTNAQTSAKAMMYGYDKGYESTKYASDKNYKGTKYSSDSSFNSSKYGFYQNMMGIGLDSITAPWRKGGVAKFDKNFKKHFGRWKK